MQSGIQTNEIRDLLRNLKTYTPTIPDEITKYLLQTAGCDLTDESSIRLVSLATQRYITEVISNAVEYQKRRQFTEMDKGGDNKATDALLLCDLQNALHDM